MKINKLILVTIVCLIFFSSILLTNVNAESGAFRIENGPVNILIPGDRT